VADAIEQIRGGGVDFPIVTERDAPNIEGHYRKADGDGEFFAGGDGADVGRSIVGRDSRIREEKESPSPRSI
jgi:hypothetical protein